MRGRIRSSFVVAALAGLLVAGLAGPSGASSQRSAATTQFSGKGDKALRFFRLTRDSTLVWKNSGNFFGIVPRAGTFQGGVFSRTHGGTSYYPRGRYLLNIQARGRWTMSIRPGVEPIRRVHGAIVFRGNGRKALPPFRVRKDSYMHWQSAGGLFQAVNSTSSAGAIQTRTERSGNSYLPPGLYRFFLNAEGNWSLRIS